MITFERMVESLKDIDERVAVLTRGAGPGILTDLAKHLIVSHEMIVGTRDVRQDSWRYATLYHSVMEMGEPFESDLTLPEPFQDMAPNECYVNAAMLAFEHEGKLTYCEGYAQATVMPVSHAWCVTNDGQVIDPTWSRLRGGEHITPQAAYLGLRADHGFLRELIADSGHPSFLASDWTHDHRAARNGFEMQDGLIVGYAEANSHQPAAAARSTS